MELIRLETTEISCEGCFFLDPKKECTRKIIGVEASLPCIEDETIYIYVEGDLRNPFQNDITDAYDEEQRRLGNENWIE